MSPEHVADNPPSPAAAFDRSATPLGAARRSTLPAAPRRAAPDRGTSSQRSPGSCLLATPLATVPPLILNRLQPLPDGLEYRFMGRDLILRDSKANLIVDFVHEAVPTIGR